MEHNNPHEVSEFIKLVMPTATLAEQRDAERNLDRFLAVIDEIHARITREREAAARNPHDNAGDDATVNSSITR